MFVSFLTWHADLLPPPAHTMLVFTELPHQSLWLHVVWSTTGRTACCSLVAWGPPAKGGNIGYYLKGFWFRCMGDCCISYSRDDPSLWQSTSGCAREWRPPLAGMQVGPCRWWRRCSPALEEQCHSCITMYKAFLSLSIELEGMCTDVCVLLFFFLILFNRWDVLLHPAKSCLHSCYSIETLRECAAIYCAFFLTVHRQVLFLHTRKTRSSCSIWDGWSCFLP